MSRKQILARHRRVRQIKPFLDPERLEPRWALTADAVNWGAAADLTLSFAPDGTEVGGLTNTLFGRFDPIAGTSAWQGAVVRAFQTWAMHTNADIGVVDDNGAPFGTPGQSRADSRFGDIRVGAIPMRQDVFAISVPQDIVSGTWVGDLLFNSQANFANVDEVFRVALHEAGNIFGLPDNDNPQSPLYSQGTIPAAIVPTADDVADLQTLFGVRAPDSEDRHSPNDTQDRATRLRFSENDGFNGSTPLILHGDITTAADVDWYRLDGLTGYNGQVTITLRTAGLSQLRGRLSVHDRNGTELAVANATDPLGDTASITLTFPADDRIYVRVAGADSGIYALGEYALRTTFDGRLTLDGAALDQLSDGRLRYLTQADIQRILVPEPGHELGLYIDDLHQNDTLATATLLEPLAGFAERTVYQVLGSIADASDIDVYRITSPATEIPMLDVAVVRIRAIGGPLSVAAVEWISGDGAPIPGQILVNDDFEFVVQFTGIEANRSYYVQVVPGPNSADEFQSNYETTISFTADPIQLIVLASGNLTRTASTRLANLHVPTWQLFHFVLKVGTAVPADAHAILRLRDRVGGIGLRLPADSGETRSAPSLLLPPGDYTLEIASPPQANLNIHYQVLGIVLSDPLAVPPDDPTFDPLVDCPGHVLCFPDASDLNGDGSVDANDVGYVFSSWGTDDAIADINTDGAVDAADVGVMFGHWTGDSIPLAIFSQLGTRGSWESPKRQRGVGHQQRHA